MGIPKEPLNGLQTTNKEELMRAIVCKLMSPFAVGGSVAVCTITYSHSTNCYWVYVNVAGM